MTQLCEKTADVTCFFKGLEATYRVTLPQGRDGDGDVDDFWSFCGHAAKQFEIEFGIPEEDQEWNVHEL